MSFLRYPKIHSIINSLWYINGLSYLTMSSSLSSACHAWASDYLTCTSTVTADLLDHEGSLSYSLKSLSTTGTANCWGGTWFALTSLTCWTYVSSGECYCLLRAIHSIHEIYLHVQHDVLTLCLCLCSRSWASILSKHLLKLLKYVAEG